MAAFIAGKRADFQLANAFGVNAVSDMRCVIPPERRTPSRDVRYG